MTKKTRRTSKAKRQQNSVAALHEDATPYRVNGDAPGRGRNAPPPIARLTEKKKLIPFGWYGGKFSHLDLYSQKLSPG